MKRSNRTHPKDKYLADIGFDIRKESNGGGSVIHSEMINIMSKRRPVGVSVPKIMR